MPPEARGEGAEAWPAALERRVAEREVRIRRAHEVAAEAVTVPAAERQAWVASQPDCLCPEFVELMIAMAREHRGEEPRESVRFAHLAVSAIEAYIRIGAEDGDDVRALAWAELGNAHRINGDLRSAAIAFHHASERVRYVADPLVRAEVHQIEAAYRNYLRDFGTEDRLLSVAERLQRRFGTRHDLGLVLIMRAETARRTGDLNGAVERSLAGLRLINAREAPRLAITAIHNLSVCLIEAGHPRAAFDLLRRFKPAYEAFTGPRDRTRREWMQARAATGAGWDALGMELLLGVRERFAEMDCAYELALVNLDLASVCAKNRDHDLLQTLAAETLAICRACGMGTESLAAAVLLDEAARRRQASTVEIASLVDALRRHLAPEVGL